MNYSQGLLQKHRTLRIPLACWDSSLRHQCVLASMSWWIQCEHQKSLVKSWGICRMLEVLQYEWCCNSSVCLPRVGIYVNWGEINSKNLMISNEVSSHLLSIGVWVDLSFIWSRGTIETFQSNLHQMLRIYGLHINSHFFYPSLKNIKQNDI